MSNVDSLHEVVTLRARVAELERERDAVTACLAGREKHLGERIQTLIESGDLSARAVDFHADRAAEMERETATLAIRVAELERERDEARKLLEYSGGANLLSDLNAARADAARLREALERYGDHHPCCDYAERALYEDCACGFRDALASAPSAEPAGPDYSGLCSAPECGGHCGYVHAVGCEAIREYLAEHGGDAYRAPARTAHLAPGAEPTPRDTRVAEAVAVEWFDAAWKFGGEQAAKDARSAIDLAAVVAKVLEVGT